MINIKNIKEYFYDNEKWINKAARFVDYYIFVILLILLISIIYSSSYANIRGDSIDYYTILQRLTNNSKKPVIDNPYFVEQRSPGYSIISALPYYFVSFAVEPFVKTENIIDKVKEPPDPSGPPGMEDNWESTINRLSSGADRGIIEIPSLPLLSKDIFFKNYYLERADSWFEWKIIFSLLLTSYIFLFLGIIFSIKTIALRSKEIVGFSLPMLTIITSTFFMQNIITDPAFATLTAFGLSSIFCYFFVRGFKEKSIIPQFLAGISLGLLVLTRLETVLMAGVLCLFLIYFKKWGFFKNVILGGLLALVIFSYYSYSQFGTPLHFGILKGDINQFGFDLSYIFANLLNPKSGVLFWSILPSLGLIGLFLGHKQYLKMLGVASLALIGLLLVRIPLTYKCLGADPINLGGVIITCPRTMEDALMHVRSDINRYITILAPFTVLGLQNYFFIWSKKKRSRGYKHQANNEIQ